MDDEVNKKIQTFTNERVRVDSIESNFNKIIALSTSMDQKILELKNTNDDLQMLQLEVRKFQDTLGEIGNRYDRIEKKNKILENTIEGVDKTFENLELIEKRLENCDVQTANLPQRVNSIESDLSRLIENSDKIDEVMDKITSLDSILVDTDKHIDQVSKNRDWIVKTEKRLDEMTKNAQDQVKLYGDLLKGERRTKESEGAPSLRIRENVVKLAHQGWQAKEIANSLNITLGEVDLILDFLGSEGSNKK